MNSDSLDAVSRRAFANRVILDRETGERVELIIYQPEQEQDDNKDWACSVEIRWGSQLIQRQAHGVDALQALISGIVALRHAMKEQNIRRFVWLGEPGDVGLPLVVQDSDQDFLALIEALVQAEHSRQLVYRKRK